MHLERSPERWAKTDPHAVAAGSETQIMYCIQDAKNDIAALAARVAELEAALREFLSMPTHRYQGDCPGPGYPAWRDPECPACQVMVRAAALLSGKEIS